MPARVVFHDYYIAFDPIFVAIVGLVAMTVGAYFMVRRRQDKP